MATSGSRNFIVTRDDIITQALRKLSVLAEDESPTPEQTTNSAMVLNALVMSWQNEDIFLWTVSDDLQLLTANTARYTLDADIIGVENVFFRRDNYDIPLEAITKKDYSAIAEKTATGDPTQFYIDWQLANPVLYLWPVPLNTTSVRTGSDANVYLCIKDHTSAAATAPITGADYADYWSQTTETTGGAHALATAYKSDIIRFSKIQRLQDFDTPLNNPDFPARWTKALVYSLAADLAPNYGKGKMLQALNEIAEVEKTKAKRTNNESADLTFSPRMR